MKQLSGFKASRLKEAIRVLSEGDALSGNFRDHQLTGSLKDFRECHITPDILLVYQIDEGVLVLTLVNVGNHSQLFK